MKAALILAAALAAIGCKKSEPASAPGSSAPAPTAPGDAAIAPARAAAPVPPPPADAAPVAAADAASVDPRIAKLSDADKRSCVNYAGCVVEGALMDADLMSADDQDPAVVKIRAREPGYETQCLTVWVGLAPAAQEKLAACADAAGDCGETRDCFDEQRFPR